MLRYWSGILCLSLLSLHGEHLYRNMFLFPPCWVLWFQEDSPIHLAISQKILIGAGVGEQCLPAAAPMSPSWLRGTHLPLQGEFHLQEGTPAQLINFIYFCRDHWAPGKISLNTMIHGEFSSERCLCKPRWDPPNTTLPAGKGRLKGQGNPCLHLQGLLKATHMFEELANIFNNIWRDISWGWGKADTVVIVWTGRKTKKAMVGSVIILLPLQQRQK